LVVVGVILSVKYVVVLVLLVVECAASQQVVYPLQIGDRWHYKVYNGGWLDTTEFEIRIAGDTTFSNGKTYAVRKWFYSDQYSYQNFQRSDSERVYEYNLADSSECVLYQFNLQPGDTICRSTYAGKYSTTLFEKPISVYSYRGLMPGFDEDVADSFGVTVYYGEIAVVERLIGAVIDGVTYGTVDALRDTKRAGPIEFQLYQNYPNPFNPSTSISFNIPKTDRVKLSVYDVLGRHIADLVDDVRPPGAYVVSWNPKSIGSGVYFLQLRSGIFEGTKRVLYLK
jgi:hypothetical protein